jgi:hypothetical protein
MADAKKNVISENYDLIVEHPEWEQYYQYCVLAESGKREEAFANLEKFIERALTWDLNAKILFIDFVLQSQHQEELNYNKGLSKQRGLGSRYTPTPLIEKFITPTLGEWIANFPSDPRPWRWQGTADAIAKAIELDPKEQIARYKYVELIIRCVETSTHELPSGYLGNSVEDLKDVRQAILFLDGSNDAEWIAKKRPLLNSLLNKIVQHQSKA